MPVSGVVICCRQGSAASVSEHISTIENVEIHYKPENDTIIAVIDTTTVDGEVALVKALLEVDGVVDVRLAYHNFEDIQDARSAYNR